MRNRTNPIRTILFGILLFLTAPLAHSAEPFIINGPLNQAGITPEQLVKWSGDSLINVYTYNFKNVGQILQSGRSYFTDKGYKEFQSSLQGSQWLQNLQRKRFDVIPVFDDPGEIVSQGVEQGIYTWTVRMPLVLHLRGPFEMTKERKVFLIKIKREDLSEYPTGLAIDSFAIKDNH